jgi:glycerol-3-phosphate cytidylyltransferase
MLKAIRYVDEITYYDTENDLYELLKRIKPDVRIIGSDWQGKQYTGYDLDIPVIFNSRNHGYSSSELRRRVYEAELKKITKY